MQSHQHPNLFIQSVTSINSLTSQNCFSLELDLPNAAVAQISQLASSLSSGIMWYLSKLPINPSMGNFTFKLGSVLTCKLRVSLLQFNSGNFHRLKIYIIPGISGSLVTPVVLPVKSIETPICCSSPGIDLTRAVSWSPCLSLESNPFLSCSLSLISSCSRFSLFLMLSALNQILKIPPPSPGSPQKTHKQLNERSRKFIDS